MARFYKRGKTWTYCMYIGFDVNGKRKRKTQGGFTTKKEAQTAAAAIENEVANGTYVEEKDISFRNFAELWLKGYSAEVKKSCSRVREIQLKVLYKYFDAVKIKDITKIQYQECLLDLLKKEYAESTISGVHGTAKMIFKKAVELDVIKNDPTQFARPPRKVQTVEDVEAETEVPRYMEKEELATFLRFAHDAGIESDYAVFLTLAYTGIRAGELCALKWQDIDFENSTIKITRTYYNPDNKIFDYELLPPKTKASKRIIPVSQKVIAELKVHQARQNKENMSKRDVWHDEDFVFTLKDYPGYPLYTKHIRVRMARLIRLSGLNEELTPHSLRHTHTSLMAEADVGLEEIMQRLGHINDKTTRTVYLHVTKDMKKEAAHKFDKLMDNL